MKANSKKSLAKQIVLYFALSTCFASVLPAAAADESTLNALEVERLIVEGQNYYQKGHYKEAVQSFEKAKSMGTSSDYQKTLLALGLAETLRSTGRFKESEDLFKIAIAEAEEDDKKHLNKKYKANRKRASDLIPSMMSDLSVLYLEQSRFPECEEILNKSVDLATKKVGPNNANLALPLNGLTRLYIKWGRFADAKSVNQRTLALFDKPAAKQNWLYLYTAFNLAQLLDIQAKYKESELLYKATLTGIESVFGVDHEYCAIVVEPMGDLYRKQSRYAEAKKAFQRARKIREATLSKEHPDYGKTLLNLALVYRDEGKYARAQDLCTQATKIIENAIGQNNIDIANCWITAASIARYQGRYKEAEDLARRASQLDEKLLLPDHPDVAHNMVELAGILADEGKFSEAEELLNKSLKICTEKLGPDHPDIANSVHGLAEIYLAQKDFAKAEPLFKRSQDLAQKAFGNDNAQVATALRELSDCLVSEKKYAEAEPLLSRALDIDKKFFGEKSPQAARDLNTMATFYDRQGKKELAAPLLAQAAAITAALPGGAAVQDYTAQTLSTTEGQSQPVKDKWALVVGISNFKDQRINLKYAAKDATDFRNFLVSKENFQPDHVCLLTDADATKDKIIANLGDGWLGKLAQPDDLVLVYVSSHGSSSQESVGVNFLVAQDTDPLKLLSTGLPMQWLTKIIQEQVHCKRVVVILDVCHSGSAADESKNVSDADDDTESDTINTASKGLSRTRLNVGGLNLGSGEVVLTSSLEDQVSWESKQYPNSVFTRRLMDALQCNGKNTTLRQAFEQLRAQVEQEVLSDRSAVQTPNLYNKTWTGGDPVLAAEPSAPRSTTLK